MSRILRHTNESGRSMVEMLGVLAIVGVLSIGGIAGYSKAMAKYKMNKALDQISMVVTNTRTIFGNQYSYAGLKNETAIDYEIFGDDAIKTTGTGATATSTLKNPFNKDITIQAMKEGASGSEACGDDDTDCPSFSLKYVVEDANQAATIASGDWGSSESSGLISIDVCGTTYKWNDGTNDLPILYSTAFSKCKAATGDSIAVTFEYN